MSNRLSIYVSSPESYKDIFDIFYLCFSRFWSKCRYRFYLSTNYDASYKNVIVISSGDKSDTWVSRTIKALEIIETKYILLLCDDLFITDYVYDNRIEHILDLMDDYNLNYCRLMPHNRKDYLEGENSIHWLRKCTPYYMDLQRGIFKRDYLLHLLGDGSKSAWDLEAEWLKKSFDSSNELFKDKIEVNVEIVPVIHAVIKGKLLPSSIRKLRKLGVQINTSREVISCHDELLLNLKSRVGIIVGSHNRQKIKKIMKSLGLKFTTNN